MGHDIQSDIHVWVSQRDWVRSDPVLQRSSGSFLGHPSVLPLRGGRPKLHLPDDQPVRLAGQHHDHDHAEIRQHRRVFGAQRKSLVAQAMGLRVHGLLGAVVPDFSQVEEVAEIAEEEKAHVERGTLLDHKFL